MAAFMFGSSALGASGSGSAKASSYRNVQDNDKAMEEARIKLTKKLRKKKDTTIKSASMYIRAVEGSGSDAIAGGFCHTFWILDTSVDDIAVERFEEGIGFKFIEDTDEYVGKAMLYGEYKVNISTHKLCDFLDVQSHMGYSLARNNCIHFAYEFGNKFVQGCEATDGIACTFKKFLQFRDSVSKKFGSVTHAVSAWFMEMR